MRAGLGWSEMGRAGVGQGRMRCGGVGLGWVGVGLEWGGSCTVSTTGQVVRGRQ